MAKEPMTMKALAQRLDHSGVTMQVSFSGGVYHVYLHRQNTLVSYRRGDLDEAVDGATCEAEASDPRRLQAASF